MGWVFLVAGAGVLAGLVYQAVGVARDRRRFPPPGALEPVGQHRLHYRRTGTGLPAVVLEAGIAASSVTWSRVQPEVAKSTLAFSYDRAGLSWSDPASTPRSIDELVAELRRLLDRAEVPPPYVLVAHSFGALVIRAFARTYPQDVAGFVFVDPLHPEEWCEPTPQQRELLHGGVFLSRVGAFLARVGLLRLSLSMLSGGAPAVPRRLSRFFGPRVAALLDHMVEEVQKLPAEVLPSVQAHWSNPKAFRGMWQHLSAMPGCSADLMRGTDDFGDRPVVVLSAGARKSHWLAADASLAQASSNGRHIVSTHKGHWVHLDDPQLVIDAIRLVIEKVLARHAQLP